MEPALAAEAMLSVDQAEAMHRALVHEVIEAVLRCEPALGAHRHGARGRSRRRPVRGAAVAGWLSCPVGCRCDMTSPDDDEVGA